MWTYSSSLMEGWLALLRLQSFRTFTGCVCFGSHDLRICIYLFIYLGVFSSLSCYTVTHYGSFCGLAKLSHLLGSAAIRERCHEGGLFCLRPCLSLSWAGLHTNTRTQSSPIEPLTVIHFKCHECLSCRAAAFRTITVFRNVPGCIKWIKQQEMFSTKTDKIIDSLWYFKRWDHIKKMPVWWLLSVINA